MNPDDVLDVKIDGDFVTMNCKLCSARCEVFSNQFTPGLPNELKLVGVEITKQRIAREVVRAHGMAQDIIDMVRGMSNDNPPSGEYPYDMKP